MIEQTVSERMKAAAANVRDELLWLNAQYTKLEIENDRLRKLDVAELQRHIAIVIEQRDAFEEKVYDLNFNLEHHKRELERLSALVPEAARAYQRLHDRLEQDYAADRQLLRERIAMVRPWWKKMLDRWL